MIGQLVITGLMLAGMYLAIRRDIKSTRAKKRPVKKPDDGEEYVYVIHNPYAKEGVFKIGLTKRAVDTRIKELFTTGVPAPFDKCIIMTCSDCAALESALHTRFKAKRINSRREFFVLDCTDIDVIRERYNEYITFVDPAAIDKAVGRPDSHYKD